MGFAVAGHHRAGVILQRGAHDLGRRSAAARCQHHERTSPLDAPIAVPQGLVTLQPVAYLDDRTAVHENARNFFRLAQQAAGVPRKIEEHAPDTLLAGFAHEPGHILVGLAPVRIFGIAVERRQLDNRKFERISTALDRVVAHFRGALL